MTSNGQAAASSDVTNAQDLVPTPIKKWLEQRCQTIQDQGGMNINSLEEACMDFVHEFFSKDLAEEQRLSEENERLESEMRILLRNTPQVQKVLTHFENAVLCGNASLSDMGKAHYQPRINELTDQVDALQREKDQLQQRLNALEAQPAQGSSKRPRLDSGVAQGGQDEVDEWKQKAEKYMKDLQDTLGRNSQFKMIIDTLKKQKTDWETEKAALSSDKAVLLNQLTQSQANNAKFRQIIETMRSSITASGGAASSSMPQPVIHPLPTQSSEFRKLPQVVQLFGVSGNVTVGHMKDLEMELKELEGFFNQGNIPDYKSIQRNGDLALMPQDDVSTSRVCRAVRLARILLVSSMNVHSQLCHLNWKQIDTISALNFVISLLPHTKHCNRLSPAEYEQVFRIDPGDPNRDFMYCKALYLVAMLCKEANAPSGADN